MKLDGYSILRPSGPSYDQILIYPSHYRTFLGTTINNRFKLIYKVPDLIFVNSYDGFFVFGYIEPIENLKTKVNILKIFNVEENGRCCLESQFPYSWKNEFNTILKNVSLFFNEQFNLQHNYLNYKKDQIFTLKCRVSLFDLLYSLDLNLINLQKVSIDVKTASQNNR